MKLLVPERGSADALSLWADADRIVSSIALYPELRSALGRAHRSGRIGRAALQTARNASESLWRDVRRIAFDEKLARHAGELAETYALRGFDAVHLASAIAAADDDLVLVAADAELLAAGRANALTTASVA